MSSRKRHCFDVGSIAHNNSLDAIDFVKRAKNRIYTKKMNQNVKELIEKIKELRKIKPKVVVAYSSNSQAMAEDDFDKLQWKEAVKK